MADFTPGDIVVYRVGTGANALTSAATAVYLDEYTPDGTLVQSTEIALPTADGVAGTATHALTASGTATSEGLLNLSADGRYLVLTGYDSAAGTTGVAGTTAASTPRVIGLVNGSGVVDTTTLVTEFDKNNPRSATSLNGSAVWVDGANTGVVYQTDGGTGAGTVVSTTQTNLRDINFYGGNLYVDSASGGAAIYEVGTGAPTGTGTTLTKAVTLNDASPYQFAFLDLSADVPGVDTLYVVDDTSGTGGIFKYSLVGSTWVENGTTAIGSPGRGLTASVSSAGVVLYETTTATSANNLVRVIDASGYNQTATATATTIATAATNEVFRGVAFAPTGTISVDPSTASVSHNEGNSGATAYTFTLDRTGGTATAATVNYIVMDGPGVNGSDFVGGALPTGTATFAAGSSTATVTINVAGDTTVEQDETFTLFLATPPNGYTISNGTATGTIVNDDTAAALPTLTVSSPTMAEGDNGTTTLTFTITSSAAAPAGGIGFNFATADGTATAGIDYVGAAGTGVIAAGATQTTVAITVNGDHTIEPNETLALNITGATNTANATATGTGTITNDDVAGTVTINNATVAENTGTVTLLLSRLNGSGDTTVHYATADGTANAGSDYTTTSGDVTFANGATTATITVPIINDAVAENSETFSVNLTPGTGTPAISPTSATVTITDDDTAAAPTLAIANASTTEGNGDTKTLSFTVTASSPAPAGGITFTASTADGTASAAGGDYLPVNGNTYTIAAGSTATMVNVSIVGDTNLEPDETFTATLANPTNATIATGTATGTIQNDDGQIIPAGTTATTFAAATADNYLLVGGTTRTQTAGAGVAVTAPSGTVNLDLEGSLLDQASGQSAVTVANNPIAGAIVVGQSAVVQSVNGNTITNGSANGTVNLTNLGQIIAGSAAFTPAFGGTNPGTDFAVQYNAAKGAANAPATDYTSGGTITNGDPGDTNALIRSDNGDAIRMGSHETLVNYGMINADGPINDASTNNVYATNGNTSVAQTYDIARGVRLNQSGETAVDIENHGIVTGSQHGLDMGQTNITNVVINNFAGAQIVGHNGSGIGSDTIVAAAGNVTVNNSGTIRGEYAPTNGGAIYDRAGYASVDGDGDGVDIDGGATITNNAGGIIQGGGTATNPAAQGAGGFDSNGRANASEGISIGGGVITNAGTITGADAAIVVNNDSAADNSRSGTTATNITNNATGVIVGEASYAIRLENKASAATDTDSIVNYGQITGNGTVPNGTVLLENGMPDGATVGTLDGVTYTAANAGNARFIKGDGAAIQMGEGNDTLSNYGTITGNSGRAVNLEGGDDTFIWHSGSTFTGQLNGGAGTDALIVMRDDRPQTNGGATGNNSNVVGGTLANIVNFESLELGTNSGQWSMSDAETYANTVTIDLGATLVLHDQLTSGSIAVVGGLRTATTATITLAQAISGTGSIQQSSLGGLVLAGDNSGYSGALALNAGTLDIAALHAAGTGAITFGNATAATLQIEAAALGAGGAFANRISGFAANGDVVDVHGIGTATAAYSATTGLLTLTGSTGSAVLNIGTGYDGYVFHTAADNAGGTAITLALPTLTVSNPTVTEGDTGTMTLTYTITSSAAAGGSGISVSYATADGTATAGTDYVATSGTATIAAGATSTTVSVTVNGDTTYESNETVLLNLSAPSHATIATAQGTGTILNDDPLPTSYAYFSTDFTGFTAAGFSPTPTAGQLNSTIWRVVGLSDNTNPAYGFTGPANGDFGRGQITTNDPTIAGVYSPSANPALILQPTGAELDTNGFIEARLQNTSGANATAFEVAFDWAYRNNATRSEDMQLAYSTDGVNFTTVPAAAFATPAAVDTNGFVDQHEDVTISNLIVPNQGYLYLRWVHADSTGTGSRDEVGIDNVDIHATLSNAPALTVDSPSVAEGNSGQTPLVFTLTRTSSTGTASVHYATADGTATSAHDYQATSGDVTFADGETSKTVTVLVNGDTAHETNETVYLNLSNPVGFQLPNARATGTITNDDTGNVAIYDIQGPGHTSPFVGQMVTTSGVVTQITTTGFYLQDPTGDGDDKTSDGVFVFTSTAPANIAVGDVVNVTGAVAEYVAHPNDLSTTEINIGTTGSYAATGATGTVTPVLVSFDGDGRAPPTDQISSPNFSVYDPSRYAIDFYESLEGMLVTFKNPLAVSNTDQYHDTYITPSAGVGATDLNSRNGLSINANDLAPEKIELYESGAAVNAHTQGDVLNNVTGVLQYYDPYTAGQGGQYELVPTAAVTTQTDAAPLARETTTLVGDANHVSYASFNLENFSPRDQDQAAGMTAASKVAATANEVVNALHNPDIIGVQEMQDDDGEGTGTDLTATTNAQRLIDAIKAAGGPTYTYVEVAPTAAGSTGGAPGGNIRNGFLYNADRVTLVPGSVRLDDDAAFNGSRHPLLADFTFNGTTFTAVDVHSYSRGGSDSLFGSDQPATQSGDATRTSEATALHNYITNTLASDPSHLFIVNGDFNGYPYENALQSLTSDGSLNNLYSKLPTAEQYSYYFDGYYQAFDNILVSPSLYGNANFDVVHYNAGYTDGQSTTDHDQVVATVYLPKANANAAPTAIAISNSAVAENQPAGTAVGTLAGTDPNGDALTYSLTDNAGGRFAVDPTTGQLTTTGALDHEATPTLSVTARVTDPSGATFDQAFTVTVGDVNEAPTALALSNTAVAENAAAGTVVGTLAGIDPDANGTLTYSLTDNAGGRFAINATTGQLTTTASLDHEATPTLTVTARVTDQGGLTFDKAFTVTVGDVNEAPTALALSNASVAENAAAGMVVGTFAGTDLDARQTFTYSLTDNGGGRFTVDPATGKLTTTALLDYETLKSVNVTATVTDQGGLSFSKTFTVGVTNVNEAPTALALSNAAVTENQPAGTLVGTASATDPDGDKLSYSLSSNPGGLFAIDATTGKLTTAQPFDYEAAATHAVTVRATDPAGLFADQAVTVAVTNVNEAPKAVTITNASVVENAVGGTVIGTLSANDPDANDTATFALVTSDSRFAINGNQLVVAQGANIDYEAAHSVALAISATDHAGLSVTSTLTLAVQDVAETFPGTGGNDTITGDAGDNTISGGAGDDTINGGAGNDTIDGGTGNDTINGGPGNDVLTLGAGADTVRSLLSELLGDTITDFAAEDRIVVVNSDVHRTDFTVSGTGAATVATFAGGKVAFTGGLAGGDLMVAHSGADSIITFDPYLAQLSERSAVAASAVNGIVNQQYLSGDTSSAFTVKVEAISGAAYSNSIGTYEVDAAGNISDVRIIAANAKTASGSISVTGIAAGHQLGFFIVQDGAHTLSAATQSSTHLSLINQGGHLVLADNGAAVSGATTFVSTSAALNVDGMGHVLSGVAADGSGDIRLGFEDQLRSGNGSDNDFQDVVLTVEAVAQSHATSVAAVTPVLHG